MFHWICPECGREIAPTVRECPVCDPVAATVEIALAGEVEAPACAEKEGGAQMARVTAPAAENTPEPLPYQAISPVAATSVAEPVHTATVHAGPNGTGPNGTAPNDIGPNDIAPNHAALVHATPADATPVQATSNYATSNYATSNYATSNDSAPPALAERIESVSPLAARSSQSVATQDAEDATDALLPQFGAPPEDGDPLGHLSSMLDSMRDPNAPEPPLSRDALPLPTRPLSNVPAPLRAFIAELGPVGAEPRVPLAPERSRQIAPEPPLFSNSIPLPLRAAPLVPEPPLGARLLALPVPPLEAVRPSTPPWEPAPPLAPLGNYSPLEGRPLRPAIPKVLLLKKDCAPRTTLPGPMLSRRLVKFTDRELRSIPPKFLMAKKRLIPGWMATALILGTLLGAGFTSVISVVRPTAEAKAPVVAPTNTPAATAAAAATPEVASVTASPLAKAIEVTGFRIQMDPSKKSEIQYLVVNHTPARFSGVTVYVTLYTADTKAGQPPLCRFQFSAPNLAPFQAKDMTSAIEGTTRPVILPDWQDLRATVEIGE